MQSREIDFSPGKSFDLCRKPRELLPRHTSCMVQCDASGNYHYTIHQGIIDDSGGAECLEHPSRKSLPRVERYDSVNLMPPLAAIGRDP